MKKRCRIVCRWCGKRKEYTDKNFIRHNGETKNFRYTRGSVEFWYNFTVKVWKQDKETGKGFIETSPPCRECIKKIMEHMKW